MGSDRNALGALGFVALVDLNKIDATTPAPQCPSRFATMEARELRKPVHATIDRG